MSALSRSPRTDSLIRLGAVVLGPAVALLGNAYHPWLGNPGDEGFPQRLAAAVVSDPTRWAVAHLLIAVGAGAVALAFLAVRRHLRDAGEESYSAAALPFVVLGSVLYALLPAMEFAPFAAVEAGADVAAVQLALLPWFQPLLLTGAAVFAVGALGFAAAIVRSGVLSRGAAWLTAGALVVMAASRFFPVGAAQLYIGPVAAAVAFWVFAPALWPQRAPTRPVEGVAHTAPRLAW